MSAPTDCDDCPTGFGHYGEQDGEFSRFTSPRLLDEIDDIDGIAWTGPNPSVRNDTAGPGDDCFEHSERRSVRDIPDADLLDRAVRSAGATGRRQERWVAVMDAFALGSTYAAQLCRRFEMDPFEQVGKRR